jgi:NAD(P)H-dependent flavin oxidoreductase YrpB (nitropropane dioxygenase family)
MPWLAGQGIGLIHDIPSATSAVEQMMAEAGDILARLSDAIRR